MAGAGHKWQGAGCKWQGNSESGKGRIKIRVAGAG
jgi:hypothetical protein